MATVGISRRSQWIVAARAVACGLVAGVLVTCYRQGIEWGTQFARWMYPQIRSNPWLIAPWALAAALVGLFVAWLIRLEPIASGSGIPQIEGVVRLGLKMRAGIVLVVRFAGGLLCGMFGLSLGREGPSIQIGAAASQCMTQIARRLRRQGGTVTESADAAGLNHVDAGTNDRASNASHLGVNTGKAIYANMQESGTVVAGGMASNINIADEADSAADTNAVSNGIDAATNVANDAVAVTDTNVDDVDAVTDTNTVTNTNAVAVDAADTVNTVNNAATVTDTNANSATSANGRLADGDFPPKAHRQADGSEGAGGPKTAETNILITAGAAAGLSSAFNAPLSGMMFALEEVHHNFSPAILLSAAAASLSADLVSKYWFGLKPVLDFARLTQLSLPEYWWMIPLGLVAGLIGVSMNKLLLGFQTLYNKLPWWIRPMISLVVALPVGIFLPQVLGGGESLIGFAERATGGVTFLVILLVVKMLFTSTSFGSGVPGGIFMPILAVGTLTGSVFGVSLHAVEINGNPIVEAKIIPLFAVCAMAGALTASVKAPMTSILLTVEMSGTLMHMLPVAACSFIALLVSDLTGTKPIYDALLDRYMAGHSGQLPGTVASR